MSCSIIMSKKKISTWKQGVQYQRRNIIYFILHSSIFHWAETRKWCRFLGKFPLWNAFTCKHLGGFVTKIMVFRDVLKYSRVHRYQNYWRICCLKLQDLLEIGAQCSSTAPVLQIPQGHYLNAHYHEHCKSCMFIKVTLSDILLFN